LNTCIQTDAWISRIVIVLGLILVGGVASILILMIVHQPMPEILVVMGSVATGGLIRLLISPLNQELSE
jgi:hypothetical protein